MRKRLNSTLFIKARIIPDNYFILLVYSNRNMTFQNSNVHCIFTYTWENYNKSGTASITDYKLNSNVSATDSTNP